MTAFPRLLGHRGALAKAPENTLASLRRALRDGAEGFEFDVRASREGVAVLLHDETVDRTTDGAGRLASMTRADLSKLDAGSHFSPEFAGERIPELSEVLGEFLGVVPLAMELKETLPEPVLRSVADRLRRHRGARLIVASFQREPLEQARDLLPAAPRALVLRRDQPLPDDGVRTALGLWGVFARVESIDERFVVDCRRAGLSCYAYVVNDAAQARELVSVGVEGVISDDPAAIREVFPRPAA